MAGSKRVAVCDPFDISRSGIIAILAAAGFSATAVSAVELLRPDSAARAFDILLFDLEADDERVVARWVGRLRNRRPQLRIVLVTRYRTARFIGAALDSGIHGCVLQGEDRRELLHAIDVAAGGDTYVSPATADALLGQRRQVRQRNISLPGRQAQLTRREYQVMCHIARGMRTRDIARVLSLSVKTIEKYRGSLRAKIGARSVAAVTAFAIAHAGLDPADLAKPARRGGEPA
ncbi:MAG TPA: response regulator transcription factor [Steroidobacteraceae bacterium]|nr:response regulator transcription factor [Steroidobacteraceae bacterium]